MVRSFPLSSSWLTHRWSFYHARNRDQTKHLTTSYSTNCISGGRHWHSGVSKVDFRIHVHTLYTHYTHKHLNWRGVWNLRAKYGRKLVAKWGWNWGRQLAGQVDFGEEMTHWTPTKLRQKTKCNAHKLTSTSCMSSSLPNGLSHALYLKIGVQHQDVLG